MKCNPGIDLPLKYQFLTPPFTDDSMTFLVLCRSLDFTWTGDEIVSRDGVANGKTTTCSRQFKKLLLLNLLIRFLFSLDGDFALMVELVKLRKKYGFFLVLDDAHGTFVCGKSCGGVAEEFNCERDIDICVGTLCKAAGYHGGFIACSKRRKQFIQSRGRSFIFSTSASILIAAAGQGSEEKALLASRLRITAVHTTDDIKKLTTALSCHINIEDIPSNSSNVYCKL
ncbi:hypothetical protein Patl1_20740 [Pistacia atlantica]|uniref:Uncharacterized protein n=1 Tax=Pistacia atlantica TaxID=434234 RepID=A0ACC1BKH2_9ROSI|nr:hypothetical protein Patl1_20740 [Pistacia atlantica]